MAGVDFFSLPMDARPGRDPIIGYDEAGNPLYRGLLGNSYTVKPQAAPDPQRAIAGQMVQGLLGNPFYGPAQAEMDVQRQGAEATLGGILPGLLQGVLQGVEAPGRAARGEPVTYGDVWATALDYGALAAPAGKPAGALGGGGIRAYHGSPHDFDRFDLSKIGTGEGAQAYGHGLYFAEAEDVARQYRDSVSAAHVGKATNWDDPKSIAHYWAGLYGGKDQGIDYLTGVKNRGMNDPRMYPPEEMAKVQQAIDYLQGIDEIPASGRMYEVNINADPADFLDWDAPLRDQPSVAKRLGYATMDEDAIHAEALKIMEAQPKGAWMEDPVAKARIDELQDMLDRRAPPMTGQEFYRGAEDGTAGGILSQMTNSGFVDRAEELKSAGIPGIKYLDAGSRGAGDGSRNFVVFDDRLIEIVRKYGIAGAAAMLGISAAELQAQMGGASAAPSADDLRGYLINVGAN